MKRTIKIVCGFVISAYALLCASVYFFPQWYFYHPYDFPGNAETAKAGGLLVQEVVYHDYGAENNGKVKGWLYLNKNEDNNHKIILFLHGNAYNVEHYYHKTVPLATAGYSVFIPEYRGFGGQGHEISQKYLEEDALNAVKYLNIIGFANKDIVIYGMSLGTYTALYAATENQKDGAFDALILEVPFTSLLNTAEYHVTFFGIKTVPLDLLVTDTYDNTALIGRINTRILVMTTEDDELIPPEQAKTLYRLAPKPKTLKVYHGASHDTLFVLKNYQDILEWLQKL